MSKYLTYIKLTGYLRQWTEYHYGCPVCFPTSSVENAAIRVLLSKLPSGCSPKLASPERIAIAVPDSKEKPAETFNHLSDDGEKALRDMISNLFKVQLWNDLFPILDPASGENISHMPILIIIRDWCKRNGIDPEYDYTVKMKWQRMREAHPFPMKVKAAKKKRNK